LQELNTKEILREQYTYIDLRKIYSRE